MHFSRFQYIDKDLTAKILNPAASTASDEVSVKMFKMIFTLGELAQISPHLINKRIFLLLQSLVFQVSENGNIKHLLNILNDFNFIAAG